MTLSPLPTSSGEAVGSATTIHRSYASLVRCGFQFGNLHCFSEVLNSRFSRHGRRVSVLSIALSLSHSQAASVWLRGPVYSGQVALPASLLFSLHPSSESTRSCRSSDITFALYKPPLSRCSSRRLSFFPPSLRVWPQHTPKMATTTTMARRINPSRRPSTRPSTRPITQVNTTIRRPLLASLPSSQHLDMPTTHRATTTPLSRRPSTRARQAMPSAHPQLAHLALLPRSTVRVARSLASPSLVWLLPPVWDFSPSHM